MPTPEHQPTTQADTRPATTEQLQATAAETRDGMPDTAVEQQRFRTIAVRVEEAVHAQLSFIAELAGTSLSEEVRTAIDTRITTAQHDPDLAARAHQAQEEIAREAAARTAAIAGFMGTTATTTQTPNAPKTQRARTPKTSNQ